MNGNVMKGPVGGSAWNSIYGTKVCEAPNIYHWKFKVRSIAGHYFMIGVVNSEHKSFCGSHPSSEGIFYNNSKNGAYIYSTQLGNITLDQGCKDFNTAGDVLDIGIAVRMPKQKYVIIAAVHPQVKEIELVSSHYTQMTPGCN